MNKLQSVLELYRTAAPRAPWYERLVDWVDWRLFVLRAA
jgi:hypothetical protein